MTLGKSLNPSGPQFPLLENGGSFLEWSPVLIEHLQRADRHPALGERVVVAMLVAFGLIFPFFRFGFS